MIDLEPIRKSVELVRRLPPDFVSPAQRNVMALLVEVDRLRALLTQAPIAKVTVQDKWPYPSVSASLYAPGLPPGEYDLYLMPDVPIAEKPCGVANEDKDSV